MLLYHNIKFYKNNFLIIVYVYFGECEQDIKSFRPESSSVLWWRKVSLTLPVWTHVLLYDKTFRSVLKILHLHV